MQPFGKLWIAQIISTTSTNLFTFALPLIAILVFDASATEVGLLVVARELPVMIFSLAIGLWLDHAPLRRTTFQILFLLAAWLALSGLWLSTASHIYTLYCVAFVLGILQLCLTLTTNSLLPNLVPNSALVSGNSKFQISSSIVGSVAPAAGGLLTKLAGPTALLYIASTFSFTASLIVCLLPPLTNEFNNKTVPALRQLKDGFKTLFAEPLLRSIVVSSCAGAFAMGIYSALLAITATRVIGVGVATFGFFVAFGSAATIVAAFVAPRTSLAIGMGRTLILGNAITSLGLVCFTLAVPLHSSTLMAIGIILIGIGTPLYGINQISIRQAVTPKPLLGRVNATRQFIVFSFLPIGALTGGFLADQMSTSSALFAAALFMSIAGLITLFSPLRNRTLWFEEIAQPSKT